MEGLTTGRIVHYNQLCSTHPPELCRAAIVTQVWNEGGTVNLYVFRDGVSEEGGVRTSVPYRDPESAEPGPCWHWPEQK